MPDKVALVLEASGLHHHQSFRQESIGNPQIKMSVGGSSFGDRQAFDVIQRHRGAAAESAVLGSHFASAILKLPGRVRKYGGETCSLTCLSRASASFPALLRGECLWGGHRVCL